MFGTIPPLTRALLIVNVLIFLLQMAVGDGPFVALMLWPAGEYGLYLGPGQVTQVGFLPWQLLSYAFLHGNLTHLFFNMFALWMFGQQLEAVWGQRRFAVYYLFCALGAGLVQLIVATAAVNAGSDPYPTVGASGGVFGVLLAYGLLFPDHRVMLLFPPIPMRARTFVILYGLLELILGMLGTRSGVAHFAHLGGMVFGFVLLQYWRRRWPFARRRR